MYPDGLFYEIPINKTNYYSVKLQNGIENTHKYGQGFLRKNPTEGTPPTGLGP